MVSVRTILAAVAALLLCACTSLEGTTADTDTWTSETLPRHSGNISSIRPNARRRSGIPFV